MTLDPVPLKPCRPRAPKRSWFLAAIVIGLWADILIRAAALILD